jgi:hypothetical protein
VARHECDELRHRQRVRIDGHVGDKESGQLRGQDATVHTVNAEFTNAAGVPMVNVQLEDGRQFAVPRKAVRVRK